MGRPDPSGCGALARLWKDCAERCEATLGTGDCTCGAVHFNAGLGAMASAHSATAPAWSKTPPTVEQVQAEPWWRLRPVGKTTFEIRELIVRGGELFVNYDECPWKLRDLGPMEWAPLSVASAPPPEVLAAAAELRRLATPGKGRAAKRAQETWRRYVETCSPAERRAIDAQERRAALPLVLVAWIEGLT